MPALAAMIRIENARIEMMGVRAVSRNGTFWPRAWAMPCTGSSLYVDPSSLGRMALNATRLTATVMKTTAAITANTARGTVRSGSLASSAICVTLAMPVNAIMAIETL